MGVSLCIAGSRTLRPSRAELDAAIGLTGQWGNIDAVICGCGSWPDFAGKRWADEQGIPVLNYPADWKQYGRRAGPIRNEAMSQVSTHLLAFVDTRPGRSRGTLDMVERVTKRSGAEAVTRIETVLPCEVCGGEDKPGDCYLNRVARCCGVEMDHGGICACD